MDPQRFVRYLRNFGRGTAIWPPDSRATRRESMSNDFAWGALIIFNFISICSMAKRSTEVTSDPLAMSKLISQIFTIGDASLNLILITAEWPRFQILTREVINFLKTANSYENKVFRKYIKRYLVWHVLVAGVNVTAIVAFWLNPVIQKTRFPVDSWYPFSTDVLLYRMFVYGVQYFVIAQGVWLASGDFMIIMLIWYASAQLELLGSAMHDINSIAGLRKCVKAHERIIRFVTETKHASHLVFLKSLSIAFIVILASGLQLVNNETWTSISQFLTIVCSASLRLFGWTWAGDDLTEMSARLSWSIYESPAIHGSLRLRKCALIVMQRSQTSLAISSWGTNFRLSLELFAAFSMKLVSFFMTLRAVVDTFV